MQRVWILGAPDPEMELIERLLRECGESVVYATDESGRRVHPGNAYRCPVPEVPGGSTVYAVECIGELPPGWRRIDHHRPGDPGYGRPPEEFLPASSIGQVIAELARHSCPENTGGKGGEPEPYLCDVLIKWGTRSDFEPHTPGARYGLVLRARQCPGEYYAGPYGLAAIPDLLPADHTSAVHDGSYWVVSYGRGWLRIPAEVIHAAAADHCLAAAYRGECPGVDPDALMRWRVETRAAFQGRSPEDVLADVERARRALREATTIELAGDPVADLRDRSIPELPEAAAREGVAFLASVAIRDGRTKVVLGGHTTPETVRAFMDQWAPAQGLVDIYGDPARGFAGGYLLQHDEEEAPMRDHVRRLRCTWERDDEGNWDTGCGEGWLRDKFIILGEGGPLEHGMRFCCYCGGRLEEQRHASD